MEPLDSFWHVLNLFAPAFGTGLLTPMLAKLLWRRGLKAASWFRLAVWATGSSGLSLALGLVRLNPSVSSQQPKQRESSLQPSPSPLPSDPRARRVHPC